MVGTRDGEEEFVRVDQLVRKQVPLGDEPDLASRVGEDEIALAGFGGVVHAEDFVDESGIEVGIFDGVGVRGVRAFEGVDLDVEAVVDVHGRSVRCGMGNWQLGKFGRG